MGLGGFSIISIASEVQSRTHALQPTHKSDFICGVPRNPFGTIDLTKGYPRVAGVLVKFFKSPGINAPATILDNSLSFEEKNNQQLDEAYRCKVFPAETYKLIDPDTGESRSNNAEQEYNKSSFNQQLQQPQP